ncbi:MAG: hypothetical protein AAB229_07875 [Candidatus Hydrogenedentota bacterium]
MIPGELITIGQLVRKRGVFWAEEVRIVEPSPDRTEPACPYASDCGGCDFHHMTYEREKTEKILMTRDTFRRIVGRDLPVSDRVEALEPHGYRNSIRIQGGAGYLGYCRKESNEIVDIDDCLIAMPEVREEIRRRKARNAGKPPKSLTIRCGTTPGALCTIETSRGAMVVAGGQDRAGRITVMFLGRSYRVSPHSFFQVNIAIAERIALAMRDQLPPGPRLLDLFAGVGTFALAMSDRYQTVTGCEISREAVEDFRHNAAGVGNVEVREWDAAKGLRDRVAREDVLILDPPRTGLPRRLADALAHASPAALAYVSCDTPTFARDMRLLLDSGYELNDNVRLFDMFPRTAHVELFAVLRKK